MKTLILLLTILSASTIYSGAQEPVLLGGGTTPPTVLTPAVGTMLVQAPAQNCIYSVPVQVVSGGYFNPPNVIYFGGANSHYFRSYPRGCYGPGYSYSSPSVIYFGRGEACERGYAFRQFR
jgi:hypothetical protein